MLEIKNEENKGYDNTTYLDSHIRMGEIKENILDIIDGVQVRLMPIMDTKGNIVSYELLSSKNGVDTESLMNDIDEVEGGKTELFVNVFSRAMSLLWKNNVDNNVTVPLSINIGPEELISEKLIDFLIDTDREYIKYINLEVLEYSFGKDGFKIYKNLRKLKEAGYAVIIDDFGDKDSNEKRVDMFLKYEILDGVKLDGKFLYNLKNKGKEEIDNYKEYFSELKSKGIPITAEYIKTEKDYNFAKLLGAVKFQGEYFEDLDKNNELNLGESIL